MSTLRILALAALLAVPAAAVPGRAAAAGATTWRFDPVHTQITFFVDHLGFAQAAGRVRVAGGWFRFDPDDWSSAAVEATIDLASLDMGDAKWSEAVHSGQFLDVERWPTARFVAQALDTGGQPKGQAILRGQLTLRGQTRPVELAVTFNRIGRDPYAFKRKAGFSARTTLARSAFGMKRYAEVVGETIEVRIEVEGIADDQAATPDEAADGDPKH
ncbi:MAG TPA: YceI family protein [Dokdonella sp.]|uniref:YceI family protein n=1 Tax=Dokdonella sp. TaxID=2291710 RepID=UPI002D19F7A1|nr:YceI family protein [Dokdonella sp.]HUD40616.1 YceI family protein [Dokdonella sp.]